jgi:hypothetical protein
MTPHDGAYALLVFLFACGMVNRLVHIWNRYYPRVVRVLPEHDVAAVVFYAVTIIIAVMLR